MAASAHRGLTLVELIVALGASAIVLVSVVAAVKGQQDAFQGGTRVREAQSSARNALLFLEQRLSYAGYGMDPVLALDLTGQPGDADGTVFYSGPCPAEMAPCRRDRVDGSDELVFYYRNPSYWIPPVGDEASPLQGKAWKVESFSPADDKIELAARANDRFAAGQILQGVCANGAGATYFTVAKTVKVDVDSTVPLELVPDVLTDPFKRQNGGRCAPTRVYQIERNRFHVRPVALGDGRFESYLMLDTGTDTDDDGDDAVTEADEVIVAPNVELLQVAYHFQFHGEGPNPPVPPAGLEPGVPLAVSAGAPNEAIETRRGSAGVATDLPAKSAITRTDFTSTLIPDPEFYEQASLYEFGFGPPMSAERKTNHQGNIRAVQLVLVGRSSSAAEGNSGVLPGPQAPVMNMNVTPPWIAARAAAMGGSDGLERIRLEATVDLPSMVSRRLLFD